MILCSLSPHHTCQSFPEHIPEKMVTVTRESDEETLTSSLICTVNVNCYKQTFVQPKANEASSDAPSSQLRLCCGRKQECKQVVEGIANQIVRVQHLRRFEPVHDEFLNRWRILIRGEGRAASQLRRRFAGCRDGLA
mmetsp:Transcript_22683/g.52096  ORF Transcript_22683/g.52096 Transcript_22683/m.52096 type:complete len:137 (-) Transcript_22683:166-576(-)